MISFIGGLSTETSMILYYMRIIIIRVGFHDKLANSVNLVKRKK